MKWTRKQKAVTLLVGKYRHAACQDFLPILPYLTPHILLQGLKVPAAGYGRIVLLNHSVLHGHRNNLGFGLDLPV